MEQQNIGATAPLSEVLDRALHEGPQRVTQHGKTVIVISEADYQQLCQRRKSFKAHLMEGPGLEDLDLERDTTPMRSVDL